MRVIAIVGPTGVGKTKLSIELAKIYNSEIISCDSMQFYKGLDIGTAKIKEEEMQGIKHHLLDILDPSEEFSVADYQRIVRDKIAELHSKAIIPILVGGSGLYINSVLYDYQFLGEKRDDRQTKVYQEMELSELVFILKEKAPKIAEITDLSNRRRVLRALEKSDNDLDNQGKKLYYQDVKLIGLDMQRDLLYERINQRVVDMIDNGLEDEAYTLYKRNIDSQSIMAIGYKEFFPHFQNLQSIDECIEQIQTNSRRYAKRQLTWFRNKMDCYWIKVDLSNFEDVVKEAIKYIEK
jgi:tRNA dimethylallyltransferase